MTVANGKEEITQAEAAKRLGMTPQALGRWTDRPGAPIHMRKGRPFCVWPDFPKWRDHERDRELRDKAKPANTVEAERRFESARATKMEMEVAVLEGSLVKVEDAARAVDGMLSQVRSQLVTFPQRWAPALVGLATIPKVQGVLEQAIDEMMSTLSRER